MTWTMPPLSTAQLLFRNQPQREIEYRSARKVGLGPDASTMSLDNNQTNRKTIAHTLALRGDKGLKELRCNIRSNARAGISDADGYHPGAISHGRYHQVPGWGVMHRLDRITDQIEKDLLYLHLIGKNQIFASLKM